MKTFKLMVVTLALLLASCGDDSVKIDTMKRTDKDLGCSEILLEINEAEFHKKQALEKKSLGIKSIVMPLGYIDTYMSADEAISAAKSRIGYLNRIYEIKNCDATSNNASDIPVYLNNPQYLSPSVPPANNSGYYR